MVRSGVDKKWGGVGEVFALSKDTFVIKQVQIIINEIGEGRTLMALSTLILELTSHSLIL